MNSAFAPSAPSPARTATSGSAPDASGLYRSTNFGATFTKLTAVAEVYQFDFGKAAPAATHPAVFIWGKVGTTVGFFRSDDTGATWVRINDNLHKFGYQNDIAGDPRVYGRVYLATSGRGVVYGDFANPAPPPPQPSQVVYDDALQNGWTNASTGGTSLVSTNPVYRGTTAISVPAGTGKGFSLTCSSRSLQGLAALTFWVHAGTAAPPPLQIGISRGGIALEAVPVTVPATIGWQRVVIPLTQLGLASIDDLTGLRIESRTVNSVTPGAFSLDDITSARPPPASPSRSQSQRHLRQHAKPVTVTTIPAGAAGHRHLQRLRHRSHRGRQLRGLRRGQTTRLHRLRHRHPRHRKSHRPPSLLGNLIPSADGTPKSVTATTTPPASLPASPYNGSATRRPMPGATPSSPPSMTPITRAAPPARSSSASRARPPPASPAGPPTSPEK